MRFVLFVVERARKKTSMKMRSVKIVFSMRVKTNREGRSTGPLLCKTVSEKNSKSQSFHPTIATVAKIPTLGLLSWIH
jgi:hypothetical protein